MINNFPVKTIIKLSQTEPANDNDDDDYHLLQLLLGDEERRGEERPIKSDLSTTQSDGEGDDDSNTV